ncbi:DEKNAAC101895 [Brettanomyces naardenensis]|uniref:DEKNAAC101895 n=1 Tax=Brettanomyces naardenensis TaxID=13370 RepID=A0A448YIY5_BRENA|nr:DEKNAAC101895 [Brettanomyces naardenensis]
MSDPSERLRTAIKTGNYFIVSRLLKRFPDLLDNIDSSNGWTNLHYAAYHDRYEISEVILSMLVNRDGADAASLQPLVSSTPSSDYTQITSEDEIKLNFDKDTVIHAACLGNASRTLRLLLEYFSVCVDQRGAHGYTPSHVCCTKDHPDCLAVLLDNGAYPDLIDDEGNTPLHLALQYGYMRCAELLVTHKADDTMMNNEGWTPLDIVYDFDTKTKYKELRDRQASLSSSSSPTASTTTNLKMTPNVQITHPPRKYSGSSGFSSDPEDSSFQNSASGKSSSVLESQSTLMKQSSSDASSRSQTGDATSPSARNRTRRMARRAPPPPPPAAAAAASAVFPPTPLPMQQQQAALDLSGHSPSSKHSSMVNRTFRSGSQTSEISPTKNRSSSLTQQQQQLRRSSTSTSVSSSSGPYHTTSRRMYEATTPELDDAASKLSDFRSKNKDRLKLDVKLGNFILNKSQESLDSPTKQDYADSNLAAEGLKKSRILSIPIASLRNRRVT